MSVQFSGALSSPSFQVRLGHWHGTSPGGLTHPPYEFPKLSSYRHLMLKTYFLLTLTSAKKVSELHTLLKCETFEKMDLLHFPFVPDFVARMQHPSALVLCFEECTNPPFNPQSPGILPEGCNIKVLSARESFWK